MNLKFLVSCSMCDFLNLVSAKILLPQCLSSSQPPEIHKKKEFRRSHAEIPGDVFQWRTCRTLHYSTPPYRLILAAPILFAIILLPCFIVSFKNKQSIHWFHCLSKAKSWEMFFWSLSWFVKSSTTTHSKYENVWSGAYTN